MSAPAIALCIELTCADPSSEPTRRRLAHPTLDSGHHS